MPKPTKKPRIPLTIEFASAAERKSLARLIRYADEVTDSDEYIGGRVEPARRKTSSSATP